MIHFEEKCLARYIIELRWLKEAFNIGCNTHKTIPLPNFITTDNKH